MSQQTSETIGIRYVRSPCVSGQPCFWIEFGDVFVTMDVEAFQQLVKRGNELLQSGPEPDQTNPNKGE